MKLTKVPWKADPHTKAKHALYRQYFGKWFPIMQRGWGGNVTYAEGFAGPGVYEDGSPGSPVIALRTIIDEPNLRRSSRDMRFIFVDEDERCTKMLHARLADASHPVALEDLPKYGIVVDVATAPCVPTLALMLQKHNAWGRPMLVVLDTWGGSVPLELVQRVAGNENSEVLITMQPQYFARFAEVQDIEHGDAVFGGREWRNVAMQPAELKAKWLLQRYRETIKGAGFDFVLDFELVDTRGQSLYLVFGTTHPRGLEKMKEAMWEVDDVAGVGYRDPRDPNQQTLQIEIEPHTAPLRRLLAQEVAERGDQGATVEELRTFAFYRTVYKKAQVKPVVDQMVEQGLLQVDNPSGHVRFGSRVWSPNY